MPGVKIRVEHEGVGHLDLAHGQLPPVAGGAIRGRERGRDHRGPPVEECLHVGGPEPVTDRLQRRRVLTGGEPVGQRGVADTGVVALLFGPLVPVEPDLGGIGEVGADLDEAGPEVGVEHVEVVDADPALLFDEVVADHPRLRRAVLGAVHPLELLGRHDGHHPELLVPLGPLEIGADVVELAVIPAAAIGLLEPQDRDAMPLGEGFDVTAEPVAVALHQRRRRDRVTTMPGEERHHLASDLQAGHVRVQVQPVNTIDLQSDMTIEHVIDVHHRRPCHGPTAWSHEGRLRRPDQLIAATAASGGGREGDLSPSR